MTDLSWLALAFVFPVFVLAGMVKGLTGMGLPTVAMALLAVWLKPHEAAALMLLPSFVTNVWQFAAGPERAATIRRFWPMMAAVFLGAAMTAGVLTGRFAGHAVAGLGIVLILYSALGLSGRRLSAPKTCEPWLGPPVGLATGAITGATGVAVLPSAVYLQALGLEKEELVQALGLSFTVSTVALGLGLAAAGGLSSGSLATSLFALVPAAIGMAAGQRLRRIISPEAFRKVFFVALLGLGFYLILEQLV